MSFILLQPSQNRSLWFLHAEHDAAAAYGLFMAECFRLSGVFDLDESAWPAKIQAGERFASDYMAAQKTTHIDVFREMLRAGARSRRAPAWHHISAAERVFARFYTVEARAYARLHPEAFEDVNIFSPDDKIVFDFQILESR